MSSPPGPSDTRSSSHVAFSMTTSVGPPQPSAPFSMKAVGRSTAVLAVGVGVGQVFGLARSLFVANAVGVSPAFDAVLVAIVIPTIVGNWLSNTMRIVLVPTYMRVAHRSGRDEAHRLLGTVLTYVGIAAIGSTLLVLAFPGASVAVSGPGLTSDARQLATGFVPILAPMLAFLAMSNLMTTVFQINKSFAAVALSWGLGPAASLFVTVALWDKLGMAAYAIGTTVGAFVTLVTLTGLAVRQRLLPRPSLSADRAELSSFARRVLPQTLASAVLQLNLISDRAIATLVSTGAASALKYGQQIVSEPAAAASTSWATVVYPAVVDSSGPDQQSTMGEAMTTALRWTLAIFVPLTVATIALAPLVVASVYGRGAFDPVAIQTTALVVAAFGPTLVLTMAQPVFSAAHNARHRGALMAVTGIANAMLNVLLNLVFGAWFGVAGIAFSSSVTLALLIIFLAWRVPPAEGFRARDVLNSASRALAASLVPGIPIGVLVWLYAPTGASVLGVIALAAFVVVGVTGYMIGARLFGVPEPFMVLTEARNVIRRRLGKSDSNDERPGR
jgi:putative peptidoglycan lipid II flippase